MHVLYEAYLRATIIWITGSGSGPSKPGKVGVFSILMNAAFLSKLAINHCCPSSVGMKAAILTLPSAVAFPLLQLLRHVYPLKLGPVTVGMRVGASASGFLNSRARANLRPSTFCRMDQYA